MDQYADLRKPFGSKDYQSHDADKHCLRCTHPQECTGRHLDTTVTIQIKCNFSLSLCKEAVINKSSFVSGSYLPASCCMDTCPCHECSIQSRSCANWLFYVVRKYMNPSSQFRDGYLSKSSYVLEIVPKTAGLRPACAPLCCNLLRVNDFAQQDALLKGLYAVLAADRENV